MNWLWRYPLYGLEDPADDEYELDDRDPQVIAAERERALQWLLSATTPKNDKKGL